MSAPALALAPKPQPIVIVRLSDPALSAACLSLVFAAAVVLLPVWFPQIIAATWFKGQLTPVLALITCLLNAGSYIRVAYIRSRKPGILAPALLGLLTVSIVVGLTAIESRVIGASIAGLADPQARVVEEILAHTYCTLMFALFIPFLGVRFCQNLGTGLSRN